MLKNNKHNLSVSSHVKLGTLIIYSDVDGLNDFGIVASEPYMNDSSKYQSVIVKIFWSDDTIDTMELKLLNSRPEIFEILEA